MKVYNRPTLRREQSLKKFIRSERVYVQEKGSGPFLIGGVYWSFLKLFFKFHKTCYKKQGGVKFGAKPREILNCIGGLSSKR